ncbi:LTA synthase family protein [Selenomonas ruminantium]|uniref:Phosphoglycerol transferase MdoB n=1 Tax=Selenomonas ruminantium TaxID=971 RepID=A0A1K1NQ69_SELRU|nr:sulfatase-like hydrolase/transferase [Selenomonas ruminantium]SFW37397.1 Phosphoglycerol transferase MdoB [Selenomonas ruminantium]
MFARFFEGIQSDLLLAVFAALVCALFRALFIWRFAPKESRRDWRRIRGCFNYGLRWGMDFNAYVFLIGMVLVSIPASFLPAYYDFAAYVRTGGIILYLIAVYIASFVNMIFYYHFHDVFNATVRLGRNADKNNLADIFFNQNHGGWIFAGVIPYCGVLGYAAYELCQMPKVSYTVVFDNPWLQYGVNFVVFALAVTLFYWLRYGGTLNHRNKPEWDEVPAYVKQDAFLGKMTMDALVAFELAWNHTISESLNHSDEEAQLIMGKVFTGINDWQQPWECFKRKAKGARIAKPRKIFLLFGESHGQAPFDSLYAKLNLMEGSQKFRRDPHTVAIDNFLPGGMISAPSLSSILSGIYDTDLEINEDIGFWRGTTPLAMAYQLHRLGYHTGFWYGGSLSWGSLEHFVPATGFDEYHGGPDICAQGAPRTWLGVYDHLFLDAAANMIEQSPEERFEFHFLYTTSNHGPYNMPYDEYGVDLERIMPDAPEELKKDKTMRRIMQGIWYADQALCKFIERMRAKYPDALFIVTGDHTTAGLIPYKYGVIERSEPTMREQVLTSFAMYHRELTPDMLANNTIGGHLNILPTLIELLAPAGHEYYSLFSSLTESINHVVTPYCWLTGDTIGDYRNKISQLLAVSEQMPIGKHGERFETERAAYSELSGYLVKHPELLISKQEKSIFLTN